MHLVKGNGIESNHLIPLNFIITNNEAEYEVILTRLAIMEASSREKVEMRADSKIMLGQITGEYLVKGQKLIKYLHQIQEGSSWLQYFLIEWIS